MFTLQNLLTNWHFMRWLRLGLGLMAGVQAIQLHDSLAGFVSIFFLFQAVTNTGCCGSTGCAAPQETTSKKEDVEIQYEEVKKD